MVSTSEQSAKDKIIEMINEVTDKDDMKAIYNEAKHRYISLRGKKDNSRLMQYTYIVSYRDISTGKYTKKEFNNINDISDFFEMTVDNLNRYLYKADIRLENGRYEIVSIGLIRSKCSDNMRESQELVVKKLREILVRSGNNNYDKSNSFDY